MYSKLASTVERCGWLKISYSMDFIHTSSPAKARASIFSLNFLIYYSRYLDTGPRSIDLKA